MSEPGEPRMRWRRRWFSVAVVLLYAVTWVGGWASHAGEMKNRTETGYRRLPDLVRYLQGIERRLDKLPENPPRDRERMLTVQEIQKEYAALPPSPGAREIRWMIEELRVNLFAQALGTAYPISDVRIYRAIDALAG